MGSESGNLDGKQVREMSPASRVETTRTGRIERLKTLSGKTGTECGDGVPKMGFNHCLRQKSYRLSTRSRGDLPWAQPIFSQNRIAWRKRLCEVSIVEKPALPLMVARCAI